MNGSGWSGVLRLAIAWQMLLGITVLLNPLHARLSANTIHLHRTFGENPMLTGSVFLVSAILGIVALRISRRYPQTAAFLFLPQLFIMMIMIVGWIVTFYDPSQSFLPFPTSSRSQIFLAGISPVLIATLNVLSLLQSFGVALLIERYLVTKCRLIRPYIFWRGNKRSKRIREIIDAEISATNPSSRGY